MYIFNGIVFLISEIFSLILRLCVRISWTQFWQYGCPFWQPHIVGGSASTRISIHPCAVPLPVVTETLPGKIVRRCFLISRAVSFVLNFSFSILCVVCLSALSSMRRQFVSVFLLCTLSCSFFQSERCIPFFLWLRVAR